MVYKENFSLARAAGRSFWKEGKKSPETPQTKRVSAIRPLRIWDLATEWRYRLFH